MSIARGAALAVASFSFAVVAGAQTLDFTEVATNVGLNATTSTGSPVADLSPTQTIIFETLGHGAAVGDFDDDGDLDIYFLQGFSHANRLYRNETMQGLDTFTDITATAGTPGTDLGDIGSSRIAHFVDLDNDGDLDLLLINDQDETLSLPSSKIFRNNGDATFTDVSATSGFNPVGYARCGCALADYNNDGLLDIYISNWSFEVNTSNAQFPGSNRLYQNIGNLTFADITDDCGLAPEDGLGEPQPIRRDSFTPIFTDFNNDGFPDLYVAIDHSSDEYYENTGTGDFIRRTDEANLTHTGNDMGVACADIDNDDDLDLYVTNITDQEQVCGFGTTQYNPFHINNLDDLGYVRFGDQTMARGTQDTHWGWGVEFSDFDNDADLDLCAVTGFNEFIEFVIGNHCGLYDTPAILFRNTGNGHFVDEAPASLQVPDDSRGLIAFDYDRDGDEDLLVTNSNQPLRLYRNDTAWNTHYLNVSVRQRNAANHFGIGVTIEATNGPVTQRRRLLAGESYLVGTPAEALFGLGSNTTVDTLTVRWTDGTTTTLTDVPADQHLIIDQPEPCDLNADTTVDIIDLLIYLSDYFADDPAADLNNDATVDVQDLLLYLECWFISI